MTRRINSPDTEADITLRVCLDTSPCVSFNMIAGAGSGKTTSLVKALDYIVTSKGEAFKRRGQQVACITYTEVAAKEIWNDVANSTLIHVSTIHSFLWTVIRPFQNDIKKWVIKRIDDKCAELQVKLDNPRTRTKERITKELEELKSQSLKVRDVQNFSYGTGSNYTKGILGHDDIIKLVTSSIGEHKMLTTIISQKYPYVFIDESQDTFLDIVNAFKKVDQEHSAKFCLGFFGDPMQKIYATGIGEIPVKGDWQIITKPENFRCSQKVLSVINQIRKPADALEQSRGRHENIEGVVTAVKGSAQIFVLPQDDEEQRTANLEKVRYWCSNKFDDRHWLDDGKVKILVIVHRMAAKRLKFPDLYSAMNDSSPSSFKSGFLDGTAWPLKPFLNFVLPLVEYQNSSSNFEVMNILRSQSTKLEKGILKGVQLRDALIKLNEGVHKLVQMMDSTSSATILDILKLISQYELCVIDIRILNHMNESFTSLDLEDDESEEIEVAAMKKYFECSAKEFWGYKKYQESESPFATQQGVKGAEFERVITVLDDDEGTQSLFSYDKYFDLAPLSETDKINIGEGKDNVISRTRRLFYVSCSRAMKDLVAVYYTNDVAAAEKKLKELAIFPQDVVYTLSDLELSDR